MPLSRIICSVTQDAVPTARCLQCAEGEELRPEVDPLTRQATGRHCHCAHPYPFLHYVITQDLKRKNAGFSATNATGCLRQPWLQKRAHYAVRPEEQVAATDGTAWHDLLEQHNEPSVLAEFRLKVQLPSGAFITGQIDRLKKTPKVWRTLPEGTPEWWLDDYKRKADEVFEYPPDYYAWQLNIYRALLRIGGEVIGRDTRKILVEGDKLYGEVTRLRLLPSSHQQNGEPVAVPLFPFQVVVDYLEECVALSGDETTPPPPKYNMFSSSFCERFCPVRGECRQYGGEKLDLMGRYNRRLFEESNGEIDIGWKPGRH